MRAVMRAFWASFFWGPPSHKQIASVGAAAGVIVVALPLVVAAFGTGGHPVFLASVLVVGLAETGWSVELLPTRCTTLAGWGRAARWAVAVAGLVLAALSLLGGLAPPLFAGVVAATALMLVLEMAPSGFANRA